MATKRDQLKLVIATTGYTMRLRELVHVTKNW